MSSDESSKPLLSDGTDDSHKAVYLPSFRTRLTEMVSAVRIIANPPAFAWPQECALIVLDAIEAYRPLYSDTMIANMQKLLNEAEHLGIPIIMSQWVRTRPAALQPSDAIDDKGYWSFYIPDRRQSAILRELRVPSSAKTIDVSYTNLFMHRDDWSVPERSHLILCGGWTESCVINTARAALDHGHPVTVVSNACAGHAPMSLLALYSVQLAYGRVCKIP